jgi:hypothetical protein
MRTKSVTPVFVEFIPRELDAGTLYISERFSTALHLCACGCGEKVATPLSPVNWRLDKHASKVISLYPSIGNWNYACKSHYWIRRNRIVWASAMSESQIASVQEKDRSDQAKYIERVNYLKGGKTTSARSSQAGLLNQAPKQSLWRRLTRWLGFE